MNDAHNYRFDLAAYTARKVADSKRLTAEQVRERRRAINIGADDLDDDAYIEIDFLFDVLRDIASDDKNPATTRALAAAALGEE